MLDVEFQEWLKSRGAKTQAGLNSRIYAVKTIEKNLAALNELCEMQGIFPEYLEDFIQEACSHPAAVMYQLSGSISECFRAE